MNSVAGPYDAKGNLGGGSVNADGGTLGGLSPEQKSRRLIQRLMIATGRDPQQIVAALARHDADMSKFHNPQEPEPFCMICLYRNEWPQWNAG